MVAAVAPEEEEAVEPDVENQATGEQRQPEMRRL